MSIVHDIDERMTVELSVHMPVSCRLLARLMKAIVIICTMFVG